MIYANKNRLGEKMFDLEKFVKENENFIYSLTHYFKYYPNKEDLYQAGMIGLMYAYKRYDSSLGVKFTTYAYPFVLGEMKKLVREDKSVKVSKDMHTLRGKIEKTIILLSQKLMKTPSMKELSEFLDIPEEVIGEALHSNDTVYSLDGVVSEDSKALTLADVVPDKRKMEIHDLIALREELSNLSTFEKDLIDKRYFENYTQSELANTFGMSQVQISRNEKKILQKMRGHIA